MTASRPHDAPSAAELVEAVREWLERDVLPDAAGRLRFHARVAINVLAVDIVLFGTGDAGHLRTNVESLLKPPLPEADRAKLATLFGHLAVGIGLDGHGGRPR